MLQGESVGPVFHPGVSVIRYASGLFGAAESAPVVVLRVRFW